jgi:hypothetical protein
VPFGRSFLDSSMMLHINFASSGIVPGGKVDSRFWRSQIYSGKEGPDRFFPFSF